MSKSSGITAVSVIIPHYGDPEPTRHLVVQLQGQRGGVELEVIVVDDSSPTAFPSLDGVLVERREVNGGYGSAVNTGVRRASHDYLLVLNSDIEVGDDFVEQLVAGAEPWMPAVVSTRVREPWGERCIGRRWPSATSFVVETLDPLARFHGRAWFETLISNDMAGWAVAEPAIVDWAVGVCLFMPAEDFRAVGGVDERFYMNCEETDLQRRLHEQRGLPVILLPEPVIAHVGGGSSDTGRRSGWLMDARMRYHEKWHGGPALYLGLRTSAAVNLAWNAARSGAGRDTDARQKFHAEVARYRHAWRTRK